MLPKIVTFTNYWSTSKAIAGAIYPSYMASLSTSTVFIVNVKDATAISYIVLYKQIQMNHTGAAAHALLKQNPPKITKEISPHPFD